MRLKNTFQQIKSFALLGHYHGKEDRQWVYLFFGSERIRQPHRLNILRLHDVGVPVRNQRFNLRPGRTRS
jgi:hypothetical protein